MILSLCRFEILTRPVIFTSNVISANLFDRGAVKSNIGHLEGASGLAGIIKAIQILEKGLIPPNANFKRLNPRIDAEFFNLQASFHPYMK